MEIERKDAIALLEELNFATASGWNNKRLSVKLKALGKMDPESLSVESGDNETLLSEVLTAIEGDEDITITGDDVADAGSKKGKKDKDKKGKKDKEGDKGGKETKAKKEATPKDRFNMRLGTRAAEINKALTKKPQTMKEIVERSGVKPPIHSHMQKLLAQGFVKKDKEGKYFVPVSAKE